jgi:predicted metal-dependent phosphoesterase TrpH
MPSRTAFVHFDLHLHTRRHSPDSTMNPFALVRRAAELRLDGVVITEHDFLWVPEELAELQAANPKVRVFAGMEVSAAEGHFLVYGIRDPFRVTAGIAVRDLCREVHRQGGAVVAAHPYRWGQDFDAVLSQAGRDLDGLELMSSNMDADLRNRASAAWSQHRHLAGLGNSDAHREEDVGVCYTRFETAIRDVKDLVEAIRAGKTSPMDRLEDTFVE